MSKLKRAQRCDWLSPVITKPEWTLIGREVEELSTEYEPEVVTQSDLEGSPHVHISGYSPGLDVEYKARTADSIYARLQALVDRVPGHTEDAAFYKLSAVLTETFVRQGVTYLRGDGYLCTALVIPAADGGESGSYQISFHAYEISKREPVTVTVSAEGVDYDDMADHFPCYKITRVESLLGINDNTGASSVLEQLEADIEAAGESIADVREKLQMAEGTPEPVTRILTPVKLVKKYLWMVRAKKEYGPNNGYQYAHYKVREGATYYITGMSASNVNQHPLLAFYDADGELLSVGGTDVSTAYTDYEVVAPEGAVDMYVNCNSPSITIRAVGSFVMTGSTIIDANILDIEDLKSTTIKLEATIEEMTETVTIGETLTADEIVSGKIYNVVTKGTYNSSAAAYAVYTVTGLKYIFVSGASATNVSSYPLCAAYSETGTLLDSWGIEPVTTYDDYKVELPSGAVTVVVNRSLSEQSARLLCKAGIVEESGGSTGNLWHDINLADIRVMEAKKNPFRLAPLDKGYVTFVVDDLLTDLDSIASLFEQYGFPLGIAAIPDRLDMQATFLQETRGNFSPGMTMRQIMAQVVANGGEIMTHNSSPVVTVDNQNDNEFMEGYFVTSKHNLENAGFTVRGLIRAGGTGAISGTPQIERWLTLGGYEYSNIGTADNYNQDRITIQKPQETIKELILKAKTEGTWLKWMVHGYAFGGGETFTGEADLIEILEYCQEIGIPVVTYGYIFDHFSSSELLEHIKNT